MSKEKIVLLGTGGHASCILDILQEMDCYEIIGATTLNMKKGESFYGIPVLGDDSVLPELQRSGIRSVAIGIGGFINNDHRKAVFEKTKNMGFTIVSAIDPRAIISRTARIGEGSAIFPGVVVHTGVALGVNCIIYPGSSVSHQTVVGDHVLISCGVTVGANAAVGDMSLLALGSSVVSGVVVGKNCVVAAGGVVIGNIPDGLKVFGVPAKPKA